MALKTSVYVSNVSNLSDARYCAGMGVERIGFVMDEDSADYVSPEKLKEIRNWLAGVEMVGQTASTKPDEIYELIKQYELSSIEISNPTPIPFLQNIAVLLKLDANSAHLKQLLNENTDIVESFIIDGDISDALYEEMKGLALDYPIIVSYQPAIEELPIKGILLKGSIEERPGFKDFNEMMEILEKLEID